MGKKICRHGRTPAYGLPNRILKSPDFSVDVSGQSVLLNDQANVIFTGLREPMLQYQTVATGFHLYPPLIRQPSHSLDVMALPSVAATLPNADRGKASRIPNLRA